MISKTLYWTGRVVVSGYARTMLGLDVLYHAPLPTGAKIIAPNHPTTIDPFLSTILPDEQAHILVSETLFKIPVFGAYLRRSGHVTVVVENGRPAFDAALRLLNEGKTVVIFPEGALSPRSGGLAHLHTGVARLALLTGAPVIPVGIGLAHERIHYIQTQVDDQPETAYWYFRGPYAITVGVPLYFKGDAEDRAFVAGVTNQIVVSICYLIRQSEGRVRQQQADAAQRREAARRGRQVVINEMKAATIRSGNRMKTAAVTLSRRWWAGLRGADYARLVSVLHPNRLDSYRRSLRAAIPTRLTGTG